MNLLASNQNTQGQTIVMNISRILGLCLSMLSLTSMAQFTINGRVVDAQTNEPIVGVQITVEGSRRGTVTNIEGLYTFLGMPVGAHYILFGALGYSEQKLMAQVVDQDIVLDALLAADQTPLIVQTLPLLVHQPAFIEATRANAETPVAQTNVGRAELDKLNNAQDLPYLLRFTPSMVVTSDGGSGVGYTGMRIRGSDASRINVNINGIPLNDAESQNVYWVNLPDLGSNASSIQIQRGVGTSSNGAGAFGGSVKVKTNDLKLEPFAEVSNTYGSFNTWKNSVAVGSGDINGWSVNARLSRISSDGYIDRAESQLLSYYTQVNWNGGPFSVKALVFGGRERTYQSWNGTPESRLNNDEEAMQEHAANSGLSEGQTQNLLNSGRTYNFYEYQDQVDDYAQDHVQLHAGWYIRTNLKLNIAGHYTYGRGFFEQFKENEDFEDYGILPLSIGGQVIESTDLIRRRWLQNDLFGGTWSLAWNKQKFSLLVGGAYNEYYGNHYGELTWMEYANGTDIGDLYYLNKAQKNDFNTYVRADYSLTNKLKLFVDVQYRTVDYTVSGLDSDRIEVDVDEQLAFINPKGGLNYKLNKSRIYVSYAIGNREPTRNDYIDGITAGAKPETMQDLELGFQRKTKKLFLGANLYAMEYTDQLVLTGELNDVGNSIRQNVDKSHRRGVELEVAWKPIEKLTLGANATFSENKIENFNEVLYDYTTDFDVIVTEYAETDIAFSPNTIAAGQISYTLFDSEHQEVSLGWTAKYVGKQYLDNTTNEDRKLDAYFVNDARLTYVVKGCCFKKLTLNLLVNNVLNEFYSSNGYTYSYVVGEQITENFYYPQAGTNFLLNMKIEF
jgi:iron complex outermembrane receptor protein